MARGQSEVLMPMVQDVLAEARCAFADLDLLAVTVGPGSFTGIRVGLAAARGLALARSLPCIGITNLEALAAGASSDLSADDIVMAAIDSKRGDIFAQFFDSTLQPLATPLAASPEAAAQRAPAGRLVIVGDAAAAMVSAAMALGRDVRLASTRIAADPAIVAALAVSRATIGTRMPAPFYIRGADATPQVG